MGYDILPRACGNYAMIGALAAGRALGDGLSEFFTVPFSQLSRCFLDLKCSWAGDLDQEMG